MQSINQGAAAFLANKPVAVTGVSRTPRTHGSNTVYRRLRERGFQVFAVNLNTGQVEGDRCYPDLALIPGGVDAVIRADRQLRAQDHVRRALRARAQAGPPECPGRAYCLPGLKRVCRLRFKAFIPLDVGGPLTLQALETGYIGVALLFTAYPALLDTGTLRALDARVEIAGAERPACSGQLAALTRADPGGR